MESGQAAPYVRQQQNLKRIIGKGMESGMQGRATNPTHSITPREMGWNRQPALLRGC